MYIGKKTHLYKTVQKFLNIFFQVNLLINIVTITTLMCNSECLYYENQLELQKHDLQKS